MSDAEDKPAVRPSSMRFRKQGPKLAPDQAKRQGEVSHFAFVTLGDREAAISFLNSPNGGLGGRPIDIALASAEGARDVIEAIERLAGEAAAGKRGRR